MEHFVTVSGAWRSDCLCFCPVRPRCQPSSPSSQRGDTSEGGSVSCQESLSHHLRRNYHNPKQSTLTKMKVSQVSFSFTILVLLVSTSVEAVFRHKSPKLKYTSNNIDATDGSKETCKEAEPCGWALYTPGSSPRKIYKYTRNIFCSCSGGDICSLTRDALQQSSFVFYCRPKESSRYRQANETSTEANENS